MPDPHNSIDCGRLTEEEKKNSNTSEKNNVIAGINGKRTAVTLRQQTMSRKQRKTKSCNTSATKQCQGSNGKRRAVTLRQQNNVKEATEHFGNKTIARKQRKTKKSNTSATTVSEGRTRTRASEGQNK